MSLLPCKKKMREEDEDPNMNDALGERKLTRCEVFCSSQRLQQTAQILCSSIVTMFRTVASMRLLLVASLLTFWPYQRVSLTQRESVLLGWSL